MNSVAIWRLKQRKQIIADKKRIWKPIKYGINNFFISNDGLIKNIKTGKIRKEWINKDGYKMIKLSYKKHRKNINIHRLLGIYFIKNPNNYPLIDHIDRNRLNNNLDNLRWVDYKMNSNNRRSYKGKNNPNFKIY